MDWKKITSLLIIALIAIIAVYDVVAINQGGTEASISHVLRVWSHKYPAITFSVGFTCGHLFWPITLTARLKKLAKGLKD